MLELLNDAERRVRVFGSVARGEAWPAGMPIRSDLDLLVLVAEPLGEDGEQALDGDAVEVWACR